MLEYSRLADGQLVQISAKLRIITKNTENRDERREAGQKVEAIEKELNFRRFGK